MEPSIFQIISELQNINSNAYIINILSNNWIIISVYLFYKFLKVFSGQTKTKIDDSIINVFDNIINGIKIKFKNKEQKNKVT